MVLPIDSPGKDNKQPIPQETTRERAMPSTLTMINTMEIMLMESDREKVNMSTPMVTNIKEISKPISNMELAN